MRNGAQALVALLVLAVGAHASAPEGPPGAARAPASVAGLARASEMHSAASTGSVEPAWLAERGLAAEVSEVVESAPDEGRARSGRDEPAPAGAQGAGSERAVEVTPPPPGTPDAQTAAGATPSAPPGALPGAPSANAPKIADLVPASVLGARSVAPRAVRALDQLPAGSGQAAGESAKPDAPPTAAESASAGAPPPAAESAKPDAPPSSADLALPAATVPGPATVVTSPPPPAREAPTTGAQEPGAVTSAGDAPAPVPAPPPAEVTTPENTLPPSTTSLAPPSSDADARARRSIASLRSACEELARAHPDLCELRTLGRSRNGLEIPLAVIGDTRSGAPSRRPALFACAEIANATEAAPDALVRAISDLLARAATQPEVAELLRTRTIYLVPAPDPDRFYDPDPELAPGGMRRVELDRNFPSGWRPEGRGGGTAGPYPLSESESNALARFLRGASNVAAVLLAPGPEEVQGSRPAEARAPGAGAGEPGPASASAGSFERFCREILGAPVLRPGAELPQLVGDGPPKSLAGPSAADPLAAILGALPELELSPAHVERLRANLWLVDVTLTNAGSFPTGEGLWLASSGARVVGLTMRSSTAAPWQSARGPAPWALGGLDGGETTMLRWIVEGEEGTELVLALDSRRAGTASAKVFLK